MRVPYIGKAEYCYSNSIAMMLAAIGESIEPARVEVLTGMGVGAFKEHGSNSILFDCYDPDRGISKALTTLGFTFDEAARDDPNDVPYEELRGILQKGPAILGPLDIGLLVYRPRSRGANGSSHYVVAYDMDEGSVYVQDPWGYPLVGIKHADLQKAWKAEMIDYKRSYYRHWSGPARVESPTDDQVFERALATYQEVYGSSQAAMRKSGHLTGPEAITTVAAAVRKNGFTDDEIHNMAGFSFPLSAKRALDYSSFFENRDQNVSKLKYGMAELSGAAQTKTMARDWSGLADDLEKMADLEDKVEHILG